MAPGGGNGLSLPQRSGAAIGGAAISALVVNPLEVVKTRLQVSSPAHTRMSMVGMATSIARREGISAFWRGTSVQMLNALPTVGVYLFTYDQVLSHLETGESTVPSGLRPLMAGISARTVAVMLSAPFENIRTQLYFDRASGPRPQIMDIVRNEMGGSLRLDRIGRLWRGLGPYFLRDTPFSAVYWTVLEHSRSFLLGHLLEKRINDSSDDLAEIVEQPTIYDDCDDNVCLAVAQQQKKKKELSWADTADASIDMSLSDADLLGVNFSCGLTAGMVAALVTTPVDVVYVNTISQGATGNGSGRVVRSIWQEEGIRGFFRGAVPRVAKVAPSCAIVIASYEMFKRLLWSHS